MMLAGGALEKIIQKGKGLGGNSLSCFKVSLVLLAFLLAPHCAPHNSFKPS